MAYARMSLGIPLHYSLIHRVFFQCVAAINRGATTSSYFIKKSLRYINIAAIHRNGLNMIYQIIGL